MWYSHMSLVSIFLVNTYVSSNCYVHSTVQASWETAVRSLPSRWEVLMNLDMGCDVTSEWNPRRCCGSLEEGEALLGQAPAAQAHAGPLLFQPGWDSAQLLFVLFSVVARSDFPPTAWSMHRDITIGCCLALRPSPHGSWRGECFFAWNDGGKQGGVGPTRWPIAGLLLWPWLLNKWCKDGGLSAGSKDHGGQRPNWSSHILIGLLQGWGSDTHPWEQVCLPSELGPHKSFPLELLIKPHTWYSPKFIVWPLLEKKKTNNFYFTLFPLHFTLLDIVCEKNGNKQKVLGPIINESESEIYFR